MDLPAHEICAHQLTFFKTARAGCVFAAVAARNPTRYGWTQQVIDPDRNAIVTAIHTAIGDPATTTCSLIFPAINDEAGLRAFVAQLGDTPPITLEQDTRVANMRCLGFRAQIGSLTSWISGFGPYPFFPATRQAPYTELTFRVKPRPKYATVMKESPPGVIHLADLFMRGMAARMFTALWHASFRKTAQVLGHRPDLRSAAKTTFVLPC